MKNPINISVSIISITIFVLGFLLSSCDSMEKRKEMIKMCYYDHLGRNTGCMIMMYTQECHFNSPSGVWISSQRNAMSKIIQKKSVGVDDFLCCNFLD